MQAPTGSHNALVLGGGAARGAYEVGVLQYVVEDVARDIGPIPIEIFCGTSVGAIHACALAASADNLREGVTRLVQRWTQLRIRDVLRPDNPELLAFPFQLLGAKRSSRRARGLVDPSGLLELLSSTISFERIGQHLESKRISAVTVSTTHVASGHTTVFVQQHPAATLLWRNDPTVEVRPAILRAEHVLASAAVPLLLPAVEINGELYCEGGLRQNVPLSPARRLGADGLFVISPRHVTRTLPPRRLATDREQAVSGPYFLLGKAMSALMLGGLEADIDRLRKINAILEAGTCECGLGFTEALNLRLGEGALRRLRIVVVRPSEDLGQQAGAFVRSKTFRARSPGLLGYALRRIAKGEGKFGGDLVSYLLFDGEFARQLIELGRADARAQHDELCAFFEASPVRSHAIGA